MCVIGLSCRCTLLEALQGVLSLVFFVFNDTATTEIYTLSLHDALPISQFPRPNAPEKLPRSETVAVILFRAALRAVRRAAFSTRSCRSTKESRRRRMRPARPRMESRTDQVLRLYGPAASANQRR